MNPMYLTDNARALFVQVEGKTIQRTNDLEKTIEKRKKKVDQ